MRRQQQESAERGGPRPRETSARETSGRAARGLTAALAIGLAAALWAPASEAGMAVYKAPEAKAPGSFQEPPALAGKVEAGELPPVAERLPEQPRVVPENGIRGVGKSGGSIRMMVGRAKDTRLLVVYGYARLLCYNEDFELEPDIAESVEVEDGRIFTIKLRKGHKWSDGHPFTTEDFRYWWEEVANNEELSPSGPPKRLEAGGSMPTVEVIDETTIRFSWPVPNPYFLPALAGARPLYLYRPAHYLKQFHVEYAEEAALQTIVEEQNARNWAQVHNRKDNLYRFDNPALPTLQPWMNSTYPPAQRFSGLRNPYYHRVDETGQQLPYLDEFLLDVVSGQLIPAKTGAGDADIQSRGIHFSDYTFLKAEEPNRPYNVLLWRTVRGSDMALYPNLNAIDPTYRALNRDARFRRALSMAIDRDEINQLIYFGLGLPGNHSVLPDSPLHKPEFRERYASFDPDAANALLDEIGLAERNDDNLRLMADGRPLEIVVETAGESTQETDVLELISDHWLAVGVKLHIKPSQREMLRNRIFTGDTVMTLWFGYENGVPTADMSPGEFAPTSQHLYHWPKWGQHHETSGNAGEPIDMPEPKALMEHYHAWAQAKTTEERGAIWQQMLEIQSEQVYTIGLVAQIPQPIVVSERLRNVPKEGIYNWDPGAQLGMYRPDSFWVEGGS